MIHFTGVLRFFGDGCGVAVEHGASKEHVIRESALARIVARAENGEDM